MTIKKEKKYVLSWITVLGSTLLGIELWLIISAAWDQIGFYGQLALFLGTLTIVLLVGYGNRLRPESVLRLRKKERVKLRERKGK
jgi:uncharacterized membrane protein